MFVQDKPRNILEFLRFVGVVKHEAGRPESASNFRLDRLSALSAHDPVGVARGRLQGEGRPPPTDACLTPLRWIDGLQRHVCPWHK